MAVKLILRPWSLSQSIFLSVFFSRKCLNPFSHIVQQVFVLKFHTIARYQLVSIFKKCKPQSEMGVVDPGALPGVPATPTATTPALPPPAPPTPVPPAPPSSTPFDKAGDKEDKQTFQVSDCRSLVKTLVCGVKTITWGITSCKAPGGQSFWLVVNRKCIPSLITLTLTSTQQADVSLSLIDIMLLWLCHSINVKRWIFQHCGYGVIFSNRLWQFSIPTDS